jgi:hypothetical protein
VRSPQRDTDGTVTFGALVVDGPSGAGVSNGVPYTWTRSSVGNYVFNFDSRLTPVTITGTSAAPSAATTPNAGPGTFTIGVVNGVGAYTSQHFRFSCTALDKRT